jgi:hypothetical protein
VSGVEEQKIKIVLNTQNFHEDVKVGLVHPDLRMIMHPVVYGDTVSST